MMLSSCDWLVVLYFFALRIYMPEHGPDPDDPPAGESDEGLFV